MSDAILFASFGGPESPEEIMPFLEHVTAGRGIPPERLAGVAHHYNHIGGRSPINEITRTQAQALQAALKKAGDSRIVYVGQRHAAPFFEDALAKMAADGVARATVFITAAYHSEASLERYISAIATASTKIGSKAPVLTYVGPWFDHPRFIEAIAARIAEKTPPQAPWVFTAHSIPCAMAKDSVYVEELKETARLVARRCGVSDWSLAFTSRSGNPRDAWLEPDISKVIVAAASRGVKDLVVIPSGFVADHVEVLYDLDVEAKFAADAAGVRLHRVSTVGDHPAFIAMIAEMLAAQTSAAVSSTSTRFRDGPTVAKVGRESFVCFCAPGSAAPMCRSLTRLDGQQ